MKENIIPQDLSKEFYTDERCYIVEQLNDESNPELSIARARVKPGVTTAWHRLKDTVERYYIQQGRGLVEVGELEPQTVGPSDIVLIPAMYRQRIINTGQEDLVFLALCTPRFKNNVYESLE